MIRLLPKLPARVWTAVIFTTAAITTIVLIVSFLAASVVMVIFHGVIQPAGLVTALLLPILLTPPLVFFVSVRHQKLKIANEELRRLAFQDSMLGCMNRHGFTSTLDIALQYASRHRPCALLIIDADKFKLINDQFGHDKGDEALLIITQAITSAIRASDVIGRIGGEEFGIFLPSTDEAKARTIAQRIITAVSDADFTPQEIEKNYPLSVSVGGVIAIEPSSFATLYRHADQQLYVAKEAGRNRADFLSSPITNDDTAAA